jgi:hypothetical protein
MHQEAEPGTLAYALDKAINGVRRTAQTRPHDRSANASSIICCRCEQKFTELLNDPMPRN